MPKSPDVIEGSDDDVELEITDDRHSNSGAGDFSRNAVKGSPAKKPAQQHVPPQGQQRLLSYMHMPRKSDTSEMRQSKLAAVVNAGAPASGEWGAMRTGPPQPNYGLERFSYMPAAASYVSSPPVKSNPAPYQLSAGKKAPPRTYGSNVSSSRPSANSGASSLQRLMLSGRTSAGTPASSLRGLSNLGNTCYMNACLIALLHTPAFVRVLLDASFHKLNMYHAQMKKSGGNSSSLATPTKAPQTSAHRRGARASCFPTDPAYIELLRNADVSIPLNFRRSLPFPLQDIHWVLHHADKRISDPLHAYGIAAPKSSVGVAVSSALRSLATRRLAGEITSDDVLVRFKTALGKADDIFAGNEQQDAHELLARVLSKLEEEGQVLQSEVVAINGLAAVDGLDPKTADEFVDDVQAFLSKMTQTEDDGLPRICLSDQAAFEVEGVSPEEEEVLKRAAQLRAQAAYTSKRTLITSRTCSSVVRATIQCSNPACEYRRFTFESYHTLSVDLPDVSTSPTKAESRRKERAERREAAAASESKRATYSSILVDDAEEAGDGVVPGPAAKRQRKASEGVESEEEEDPLVFDIESMYHYADVASGYPPPKENQLPPKVFGLLALLKYFFRPIRVSLNCPKPGCGCKSAVISYKLVSLPRVLILHIKRFEFTMDGDCVKRLDFVSIPPAVELAEMCDDTIQLPPPMDLRHPDEVSDEIALER
jgi:ubiquitin C-terminal hydrolase